MGWFDGFGCLGWIWLVGDWLWLAWLVLVGSVCLDCLVGWFWSLLLACVLAGVDWRWFDLVCSVGLVGLVALGCFGFPSVGFSWFRLVVVVFDCRLVSVGVG